MSVKEFFAFGVLKQKVIDFLKVKADYDLMPIKHKRAFRAHINKVNDDYYVCDDLHCIKCIYSEQCKELFEKKYLIIIKILYMVNMLVCVQDYLLVCLDGRQSKIEVAIDILEL